MSEKKSPPPGKGGKPLVEKAFSPPKAPVQSPSSPKSSPGGKAPEPAKKVELGFSPPQAPVSPPKPPRKPKE